MYGACCRRPMAIVILITADRVSFAPMCRYKDVRSKREAGVCLPCAHGDAQHECIWCNRSGSVFIRKGYGMSRAMLSQYKGLQAGKPLRKNLFKCVGGGAACRGEQPRQADENGTKNDANSWADHEDAAGQVHGQVQGKSMAWHDIVPRVFVCPKGHMGALCVQLG